MFLSLIMISALGCTSVLCGVQSGGLFVSTSALCRPLSYSTCPIDTPGVELPDTSVLTPQPVPLSDIPKGAFDGLILYMKCRSSFVNHEYTNSGIETGYIGKFRGKKIFFETGHIVEATDGSFNYLFLRTDTSRVDSFDICLIQYTEKDTVLIKRIDSNGVFQFDSSLTQKDFPSLLQILVYSDDVAAGYMGLNEERDQRIYFRGNELLIQHWKRYHTNAELVRDSYLYDGNRFRFHKSKIVKEVDYYK